MQGSMTVSFAKLTKVHGHGSAVARNDLGSDSARLRSLHSAFLGTSARFGYFMDDPTEPTRSNANPTASVFSKQLGFAASLDFASR